MTKYAALLVATASLLMALTSQAEEVHGATSPHFDCRFDEATGTATVTGTGPTLYVGLNGETIQFVWYPSVSGSATVGCLSTTDPSAKVTPTLSNTDSLVFDVEGEVSSSLWNRSRPGPGRTPEPETSEVETYVGPDVVVFTVALERAEPQEIELGSLGENGGVDLDVADEAAGAADPDVIITGPSSSSESHPLWISAAHGTGQLNLSADGGRAFDGPFPSGVTVFSSNADDTLVAGAGPAQFLAGGGHNTLVGSARDDGLVSEGPAAITAGPGDDWLAVGSGGALLDGGPGVDRAGFISWTPRDGSHRGVHVDLGASGPQDIGFGVLADLVSIEELVGSEFNDRLVGTGQGDRIEGWGRNDRLRGRAGDDLLLGGDGNDVVGGGGGFDVLRGNRDTDRLNARDGLSDRLIACGPGSGAEEHAVVDPEDPPFRSC